MGETLIRVTDVTYEDSDDLVVKVVGRAADGRRVVKKIFETEPYMFIPESAPTPHSFDCDATIVDIRGGFESYDGVSLLQIVTEYPKGVREIRKEYEHDQQYESDLIYERRCTADYALSGYIKVPDDSSFPISEVESIPTDEVESPIDPRICYIDIEAVVPDTFTDDFAEEAPNEVTAITAYDSYDEEYTLFCLDPEYEVEPGKIRGYIEDHWRDSDPVHHAIVSTIDEVYRHHEDEMTGHEEDWKQPDRFREFVLNWIDEGTDIVDNAFSELQDWDGDEFEDFVEQVKDHVLAQSDDSGNEYAEKYADCPITFKRFGDETSLLEDFIHYIQEKRPDVATGWNYVDFDHEYLFNRIKNNGDLNQHALSDMGGVGGWQTEKYIPGLPAVDMMTAMQKIIYGQKESWSLEFIASDILGIGKVSAEGNSYDENRSMFMAYNVVDTQLCVALDDVRGVMDFWYQLADICSIPLYSVGSEMKEVEGFLFKHRGPNEILPRTPEDRELDDISGGFVMPPSSGIREWVAVTDLKSLYPSSIITCNISRETMVDDPADADIIVPNMPLNYEEVDGDEITRDDIGWTMDEGAHGFTLDKEGILPKYIKLLFDEREKKKDIRDQYEPESPKYELYNIQQRAVKVIMNSFFGVSDNDYFRLSAQGKGDAITSASRFVQWYGVQEIESQGYEVIYGDTDSLMLEMAEPGEDVTEEEVIQRGKDLDDALVDLMSPIASEFGIPDDHPYIDVDELPHDRLPSGENHLWQYEFEKLYRRFFQPGSKKRYAGWIIWKEGKRVDDTDTVGMESQRSDSPALAKEVQKTFIELVLKSGDFDELSDFVQEKVEKIRELSYDVVDIGVPSTINKPVDEYPNGPMPRGVKHVNNFVDGYYWTVGDDPWLVYVNEVPQGVRSTDVLALSWTADDLPAGYKLDVDKHVEKAVKQPINAIVQETEHTWSELKTGKSEQSVVGSSSGGTPDFGETEVQEPDFGDDDGKDSKPKQNSAFDW